MTRRKHLILLGPSGKQAGLKNQSQIAHQLLAVALTKSGLGGGITTLLLPITTREKQKLDKLERHEYRVKEVNIRAHNRKKVRDAVSDQLLVKLGENFLSGNASSPRARSALIREFSEWICSNLKDHQPNAVRSIVAQAHPDLVDRTSSDWWRKRIAQRKK